MKGTESTNGAGVVSGAGAGGATGATGATGAAGRPGQDAPKMEGNQLARRVVEIAADRKAEDIVMLDISKVSIIADYFVICTGTSDRHVRAIAREIDEKLGQEQVTPLNVEGMTDAKWVLMDYGPVLVHIFDTTTRDYYRLEQLWSEGQTVLMIQ